MANLNILALLLADWVVAFAYFSPLALAGRTWIYRRPKVGLSLWLSFFTASCLAFAGSLALACYSVFATWLALYTRPHSLADAFTTVGISFAPWLILALAGIGIALANQKLSGLFEVDTQIDLGPLQTQTSANYAHFPIVELPLDVIYVGSSSKARAIVQTRGARLRLEEAALVACYEHEAAHLRGNHAKILSVLVVVQRLLGGLYVTKAMVPEVSLLLELIADRSVGIPENAIAALSVMPDNRENRIRVYFLSLRSPDARGGLE